MHDKIKGLEKSIQTYIDAHPDCEVELTILRDSSQREGQLESGFMSWRVIVSHKPNRLL